MGALVHHRAVAVGGSCRSLQVGAEQCLSSLAARHSLVSAHFLGLLTTVPTPLLLHHPPPPGKDEGDQLDKILGIMGQPTEVSMPVSRGAGRGMRG